MEEALIDSGKQPILKEFPVLLIQNVNEGNRACMVFSCFSIFLDFICDCEGKNSNYLIPNKHNENKKKKKKKKKIGCMG
jgi:hypothetical protein